MTPQEYREARQSLGLSQQKLAEKLGMTVRTISLRETGAQRIDIEAQLALLWLVTEE
jgi:transcriptional regulator with XRE-family HTH domain